MAKALKRAIMPVRVVILELHIFHVRFSLGLKYRKEVDWTGKSR